MNFFIRYKKILILLAFVAAIFVLGYLLYILFFRPAPIAPPAEEPGEETTGGKLPISGIGPGQVVLPGDKAGLPGEKGLPKARPSEIANGGLTKATPLAKISSQGATISSDGSDLQYYNKEDEKFYKIDKNGKASLLSEKAFHSVEKITWSPIKNKAILEYPDGANIIYDFSADKQITLPSHWKDFNFSPDGAKIVTKSIGLDPNNRWLAIANDDGSKVRVIEDLGKNESTVYTAWSPNNQTIAMYTKGVDFNRQEVFFVGLNDENFKSTIVEGRGFQPLWQPSGNKLVYSVYSSNSDYKPLLWAVNASGESIGSGRKNLNIETWAEKCAFAGNSEIYCAVPEKLEAGSGLFPELAKNTKDNLYKIDINTGSKKLVAVPDGSYNMSNLLISGNGYYLYFTDQLTGNLIQIKLK